MNEVIALAYFEDTLGHNRERIRGFHVDISHCSSRAQRREYRGSGTSYRCQVQS